MKHLAKIKQLLNVANEELADGQVRVEREHVFYARITDFEQLKKATEVIKQEQWQLRVSKNENNVSAGQLRSRKNVTKNSAEYVLTLKTQRPDGDRLEVNVDGGADAHEMFKLLSDCGMIKDRHVFEIPDSNLKFEIDVFLKPDGSYHNWCKIDVEVEDMSVPLPAFPITLVDIMEEKGNATPSDVRDKITSLYDECFLTRSSSLTSPSNLSDVTTTTVTMEGLMDNIKGALKSIFHNPRKQERDEVQVNPTKDIEKTIKLIKETLANDNWVSNQTITDQPISSEGIAKALAVGGKLADDVKPDVKRTVDEIVAFAERCSPRYQQYGKRAKQIVDTLHKPGNNPEENWNKACAELTKLEMPGTFAMTHEPDVKNMIGGITIKHGDSDNWLYKQAPIIALGQFDVKDQTVRPLDSLEIIGMAETIVYLLEKLYPLVDGKRNIVIRKVGYPLFHISNPAEGDFEDDVIETYEANVGGNIYETAVYEVGALTEQLQDPIFEYDYFFHELANNAIKAMLNWINKSFK